MSVLLHRTPCWRPLLYSGRWRLPAALARLGDVDRILLTFDDGPSPASAEVARILESEGARAAFFLRGDRLPHDEAGTEVEAEARATTRDLLRAGHLVGCHGLSHERLALKSPSVVRRDLVEARARIEAACGFAPQHFRPPYGSWTPWHDRASRSAGMEPFFWSLNPFDYKLLDPQTLIQRILTLARSGDILLLHCTGQAADVTRAALPGLLQGLRARRLELLDPLTLLEDTHV